MDRPASRTTIARRRCWFAQVRASANTEQVRDAQAFADIVGDLRWRIPKITPRRDVQLDI
jgi:hypothetical protein